ncbi:MAG: hypothetical protein ACM34N_00340 [Ignavibacteria bacterium]
MILIDCIAVIGAPSRFEQGLSLSTKKAKKTPPISQQLTADIKVNIWTKSGLRCL